MYLKKNIILLLLITAACSSEHNNRETESEQKSVDRAGAGKNLTQYCPNYLNNFGETLFYLSKDCLEALPPASEMALRLQENGYDVESLNDELTAVALYQELAKEEPYIEADPFASSFSLVGGSVPVPPVSFDIGNLNISTSGNTVGGSATASCSDDNTINASATLSGNTNLNITIPNTNIATINAPILPRRHFLSTAGTVSGPVSAYISGNVSGNMRRWSLGLQLSVSGSATVNLTVWNRIVTNSGIDRGTNTVGTATVTVSFSARDSIYLTKSCSEGFWQSETRPVEKSVNVNSVYVNITGGIFRPNRHGPIVSLIRNAVENYINNGAGRRLAQDAVDQKVNEYISSYQSVRQNVINSLVDKLPGPKCIDCTVIPTTTMAPTTTTTMPPSSTTTYNSTTTMPSSSTTTTYYTTTTMPYVSTTAPAYTTTTMSYSSSTMSSYSTYP